MKKMGNTGNDKELYKSVFVKRVHLPLERFWSFQKFIPTEVVDQIHQSNIEPSPVYTDRSDRNAVHGICHESEDVFNAASNF